MPYATLDDLRARFGESELVALSVLESGEEIDAARVDEAIAVAVDQVESYLRKRYTVPLASVPRSVRDATCVLAGAWLAETNPRTVPSETQRRAKDDTLRWLRDLSKGDVTLEGVETPASPGVSARVSDRDRRFDGGSGRTWW